MKKEKVDILEGNIPKDIMDALLRDHTTQRNIFWATKDYEQWGDGYAESDEITYEKVCDNNKIIPRVLKDRLQQTARSRDMAEVFTPSWVCNAQNNLIDNAWFGREGVVYVLKNRSNSVNIDQKNRLHPFYMVYLTDDGEVFINHLQPKELLDRVRYMCRGKVEPLAELCRSFNKETKDGYNMKHYSDLLGDAITSIINVKQESDIISFLNGYQGELFTKEIKGLDDFELICFLVVR